MASEKKLLIIDDEENMRHMLQAMLVRHGYAITVAGNGRDALDILKHNKFDYILCDVRMSEMDGLQFLQKARENIAETTVIMMSAYGSIDIALEAMKQGAYDFISKPFKSDEVLLALKKAEERELLRLENQRLRNEISEICGHDSFGSMIGESKTMVALFQLAKKIARYDTTVLITGDSGTGKELVAKGIHLYSQRKHKKIVAINCGGIPENLLESEFFGYTKGAFTGADTNRKGLFEEADGGTLFLDEIGELPLSMQVKLLRVLQEGSIRAVGASSEKRVNVRILAATARNLEKDVQDGLFREDLFYRLNVLSLHIPPLRERPEDIPLLCNFIMRKYNKILNCTVQSLSSAAMDCLMNYSWPGNVRELENVIQRGLVLAENRTISREHLPVAVIGGPSSPSVTQSRVGLSLKEAQKELEMRLIRQALDVTNGNKTKAALLLEMSYPSLLGKIKEYFADELMKGLKVG